MQFEHVSIVDVSAVDAPYRVTSSELEARLSPTMRRLQLAPDLLENLSGIVARRMWDADTPPSAAATLAARAVIEKTGVDPQKIGVIINTSVCRDFIEPSVACIVHGQLGLAPDCINFDLGNACLGFMSGMEVVGNMIERGQVDYGLVVDGENSRFVVDSTIERLSAPDVSEATFRANFATLTLGSGGAAMLLSRSDLTPSGHRFLGGVSTAATEHHGLCKGQVDGMITDTRALLIAGIQLAVQTYRRAGDTLGWDAHSLDELVLHQVSKAHTEKLAQALELDLSKVHRLYPEYGNVGPAAVPMVLAKAVEAGRINAGDRVGMMGIGSGLNCSMAEIVW
jgi:3-oxoacyl-[acyl-carrier-protein] synthase-3